MTGNGGEFAFIRRLAQRVGPPGPGEIGIGDDAAVLADGTVAAIDTLVQDRHFRLDWTEPEDIGWKALAVNLSDLAAMGAEPTAALVAVTLPPTPSGLADRLSTGLLDASTTYDCPLVGGDTTSGSVLVITVAVLGRMATGGSPVPRDGARPGDAIYLTGPVGAAVNALDALEAGHEPVGDQARALHRPRPRLAEGRAAAEGGATAMIDVSDGLGADLGHVLDASAVGARVEGDAVPLAGGVTFDRGFGGGDDYELCFTAADHDRVMTAFATTELSPPIRFGTVTDAERVLIRGDRRGPIPTTGWSHPVD